MLRSLCLIAFVVFAPATASSACGWVLWKKTQVIDARGISQPTWVVEDAAPGFEDCRNIQSRVTAIYLKSAPGEKRELQGNNGVLLTKEDGAATIFTFLCLPSDVDPRPRKN